MNLSHVLRQLAEPKAFWLNTPTPQARMLVRRVLKANTHPVGMTSHQIYERIHELYADEKSTVKPPGPFKIEKGMKGKFGRPPKAIPDPPHREHPIRSLR